MAWFDMHYNCSYVPHHQHIWDVFNRMEYLCNIEQYKFSSTAFHASELQRICKVTQEGEYALILSIL
jgi:hypothetical protein